jgi:hypothetical protein
LAVASGADAEGVGRGFGSGGMLGAAGGLLGDFLPGKREAQRRARHRGAENIQVAHRQLESLPGFADQLRLRILEFHGRHRMRRDDVDALRRVHLVRVDDEGGYAFLGPGEGDVEIGDAAVGDPGLGAAYPPFVRFFSCNTL